MSEFYYWPSEVPRKVNYKYGKRPLFEYVVEHAKRMPDKDAFIFHGRRITWKELDDLSNRFANFLSAKGVKKGDSVGVYLPNSPQFPITYLGINKIGASVVALNPTYREYELEYMLNQVETQTIVTLDAQYQVVANVLDKTQLKTVIVTSFDDFLPEEPEVTFGLPRKGPDQDYGNSYMLKEILEQYTSQDPRVEVDLDDVYLYIFTSGTTGLPKGAMITFRNAIYKAAAVSQSMMYPVSEEDVNLISLPIMHIAGLLGLNASMYMGMTSAMLVRFEPEEAVQSIEKYQCTHWVTVTNALKYLLQVPGIKDRGLSSLKKTLSSSLAMVLTEDIAREWGELTGSIVSEASYGLTEEHTGSTFMPTDKIKFGKICCGLPVPENIIITVDPETKEALPQGETGEIAIKSEGVFKGYLKNPAATNEVLRDGWLFTGDMGMFDEDGYLWFQGRKKEMIKTSGFSVFPEEVEGILLSHPAIADVGVFGTPDEELGEAVKAAVVLTPDYKDKVSAEDIIEWAGKNMGGYKKPKAVEIREDLPKGGTGKILRRVLQEEDQKK